jgi:transposase
MFYVGIDYHKESLAVCIMRQGGAVEKFIELEATPEGMDSLIKMMCGRKYRVMGEAFTYAMDLHNYLIEKGVDSYLVDAKNFKVITKSHKKTDKNDSETIAWYLRLWSRGEIKLSISYIVRNDEMKLRDLCRLREDLAKQKGQEMQRIRMHMRRNGEYIDEDKYPNLAARKALRHLQERFSDDHTLMERIKTYIYVSGRCESIDNDFGKLTEISKEVGLLTSIPGIGDLTGVQMMSMIVSIDRFETVDKMRSFFGMAPNVRNSGETIKHGHITKAGDPMMRTILNRIIHTHMRCGGYDISAYYA